MNVVFTVILGASCVLLAVTDPGGMLPAFLDGAANALRLSALLFGSYALWLSAIKILEASGAQKFLRKLLKLLTNALFPGESEETSDAITLNFAANLIGAGGAATPAGLKAMSGMRSKKNAVMLVVLNSTSLQLIPTTVIAIRAGLGSVTDVILPTVIVTLFTSVLAVIAVKVFVR